MILREKEKKIVQLIGQGKTNKEIAQMLDLKDTSVAQYIYNMCRLVGAGNRIELYNLLMK